MNLTGHIHVRGVWAEIRNERALRSKLAGRKRIPYDYGEFVEGPAGSTRRLFVELQDGSLTDTGSCVYDALSETDLRMSSGLYYRRSWWTRQMAWYAEHRWVNVNEQARDDVDFARSSYKWW